MYAAAAEIEAESRLRQAFVERRLCRPASPDEMKDLTDFFHDAKANLLACNGCGLLVRQELEGAAETYSEDQYNPSVMERQYPAYLDAFRKKEKPFRHLLPPRATVLEIGSHYGAFLQTAAEWGWSIEGIDIGRDTSRFASSKGCKVHRCELPECAFNGSTFDGVFIWNCFEQIENPAPLLAECRRILKPGGILVLRTPNARFYRTARKMMRSGLEKKETDFLVEALAYNNLLGFPYLYGYTLETLSGIAGKYGFAERGYVNSELLTFPLPDNPAWVGVEERRISSEVRLLASSVLDADGALIGPWIECWYARR